MKYSTLGLNNDLGIAINLAENFLRKNKKKEKLADEISQLLIRQWKLIEKMKYYWRY